MADTTADILSLVTRDHDQIEALFDELEGNEDNLPMLRQLYPRLRQEILRHDNAEEAVLYPALRDKDVGTDYVTGSVEDHTEVKRQLSALNEIPVGEEVWLETLHDLRDLFEIHMEHEEDESLDDMTDAFTPEELVVLGERFSQAREGRLSEDHAA